MSKLGFNITYSVILLLLSNNTFSQLTQYSQADSSLLARQAQLNQENNDSKPLAETAKEDKGYEITFESLYQYGNIRGFLQTPAGGTPGSSSAERPTFKELGIDSIGTVTGKLSFINADYNIYLGMNYISISDSALLSRDLISRTMLFAAGSRVNSDLELSFYSLGCQFRNLINIPSDSFSIDPIAEIALFDFGYRLAGVGGPEVSRYYSKVGGRLGLALNWDISEKLFVSAQALAPIPISNTPYIWSVDLMGKYLLYSKDDLRLFFNMGLIYEIIDYEDNQELPNHIRAEMGPMATMGLAIHF